MSNILISGLNGFVGTQLAKHLQQCGHVITGLSRKPGKVIKSYLWRDIDAITNDNFDTYIHLAGKAHDLSKAQDANEYFEVNTNLTKVLYRAFLQSNATTFIYMSSVKAVADSLNGKLTEDMLPKPLTPYGQSKHQAEQEIQKLSLPPGKRVFILRPCMIHGPGNKGNLNLLYKFVQIGIPYPLAAFQNKRSFLSIDNLNYVIEKLISEPDIPGGIYNLADDIPLSTNDVMQIIAQSTGRKIKLWKLNPNLIKLVASIGDCMRLPLNNERLKKLTESYVVSNDKLKKELGIIQLPISSAEGLAVTICSFNSGIIK